MMILHIRQTYNYLTVAFMGVVCLSLLAVWDVLTQTNSKQWTQK